MRKKSDRERPLIGITPDIETIPRGSQPGKRNRLILLHERYARAMLETGGLPIILPIVPARSATQAIFTRLDGILISGGNFDIDPGHYGETSIAALGEVKEDRTQFELELISLALERNLPVLGVCGGAQAINVALGGTLYQDIASQIPAALEHQQGALKDRGGHAVAIHDGTLLRRIVGQKSLETNTTHHQSVKRLGTGLIVNATAEDGVIEGLESREHAFVLGVQWHPEFLIDKYVGQKKIFAAFVSASSNHRP